MTARSCFLLVAVFCALSVSSAVAADRGDILREKTKKVAIASVKTISTGSVPIQAIRVLDKESVLVVTSHVPTISEQIKNKKKPFGAKRALELKQFAWSKWNLSTGHHLLKISKELPFLVHGAMVGHDGSWVAAVGNSIDQKTRLPLFGAVVIWDSNTGQEIATWKVKEASIEKWMASPTDKCVALACLELRSRSDIAGLRSFVETWKLSKAGCPKSIFSRKRAFIRDLSYDPEGTRLYASFGVFQQKTGDVPLDNDDETRNSIIEWDTRRWKQTGRINVSKGFYDVPFVRSNGRQTVTLNGGFLGDSSMEVWDFRSGRKILRLEHKESPVLPVVFSPKGDRLTFINAKSTSSILTKRTREITLINIESGAVVARLWNPKHDATAFSFTKDGRQIISGSSDGGIRIWKLPPSR